MGLFGDGIGNQIVKGAISKALKLYTPKGPGQEPEIWIRKLKVEEEDGEEQVSLEIKAPYLLFQAWALLNLRKGAEEFLDLEEGQALVSEPEE